MGKFNAIHRAVMRDLSGITTLTHDHLVIQNIKREKSKHDEKITRIQGTTAKGTYRH